jgi:dipeptidyl aminopeptidase/acylaminoacyl peptidase
VGEQWDGEGLGLSVAGWSRVPGDQRLALVHEREGKDRPAVWDVATGERRDLPVDLPGDVTVAGWWPNGSGLLVVHQFEGRDQLYRLDLGTEALLPVKHPVGTISDAAVRPDGEVWYRVTSGAEQPTVRAARDHREVVAPDGPRAPKGQPFRSWRFTNPLGQSIHGFVAAPATPGPHPVVMLVHGGPTWAYTDSFSAEVQAWVDHGFVVAMVNYRGSTGYGVAFRDALIGNPGFPEVEDVTAGLDDLVASGVADPARAVVSGGSWGGYISLLALGREPARWAAGVAAVPVADYPTAFRDEAPSLQSFDRSLFGGGPDEVGDLYVERSPLTYVDRVRAPVLVLAGDNDSRCPIQQVLNYVEALRARGGTVELYRFDAGHGSMVIDERVRQMAKELAFVLQHVPLEAPSTST